jgi:hypothetical protein
MNVETLMQAVADALGVSPGHEPAGPYLVAFLSSTAVEVIAVATVLAMVIFGSARTILRSGAISHAWLRLYRALDVLKLHKVVIPLACLTATIWVWTLVQGV